MKTKGLLLNCAIGDASGMACEYADEMIPEVIKFDKYYENPKYRLKAGTYTDDTQMSLALAELMLEDVERWNREIILNKFLEVFKRDPRDGYSRGFQSILEKSNSVEDLINLLGGKSDKSGAAMRSAVLGLYPNEEDVIRRTVLQACTTHNSEVGIRSSLIVSLTAHALYYKKINTDNNGWVLEDLRRYLNDSIIDCLYYVDTKDNNRKRFDLPHEGKIKSMGFYAPCAAITDLSRIPTHNDATELLARIFNRGGDTDTAGAIGMSLLACEYDEIDVPDELYYGLENDGFGRIYLEGIDKYLMNKFPRP